MKKLFLVAIILIAIIVTAAFLFPQTLMNKNTPNRPFYAGVTYCGNSTAEAKLLIDRVKTYTNLFVIQSLNFSQNETALTEICDYAVAQNLNIIINPLTAAQNYTMLNTTLTWQLPLLQTAKERWGEKFLALYYDDEPGGIHLDYDWTGFFNSPEFAMYSHYPNNPLYKIYQDTQNPNQTTPRNYTREAKWFTNLINRTIFPERWKQAGVTSLTSDYAFYWWDYLGGYDVILAQLGWNHTLTQDIALVRGAAHMQNKSWGTILTWKYDRPPYIDSPENIYQQLLMSYQAGATYAVIFNYPQYPEGNPYGILTDEHLQGLERFWNEITTQPNAQNLKDYSQAEAVLVLPQNYGWGMRNPNDRIWGMWGPDERSPQIWNISRTLLTQYGLSLDIIYEDPAFPPAGKYSKIYYWNQTI